MLAKKTMTYLQKIATQVRARLVTQVSDGKSILNFEKLIRHL